MINIQKTLNYLREILSEADMWCVYGGAIRDHFRGHIVLHNESDIDIAALPISFNIIVKSLKLNGFIKNESESIDQLEVYDQGCISKVSVFYKDDLKVQVCYICGSDLVNSEIGYDRGSYYHLYRDQLKAKVLVPARFADIRCCCVYMLPSGYMGECVDGAIEDCRLSKLINNEFARHVDNIESRAKKLKSRGWVDMLNDLTDEDTSNLIF